MPRLIVRLMLAVLILASLFGGRSLVANVADGSGHVVKSGETLSGIAAQYGVTVEQLVTLNGITDPNRVGEGQTLKLPPAPARSSGAPTAQSQPAQPQPAPQQAAAPQPSPAGGQYLVQAGDTLSGIAKSLGVTMKALLEANELVDPDRLTVGQKLSVPAGAVSAPAGTTAARSNQPGSTAPAANNAPAAPASDEAGATLDRLAQQYGVDPALARALAWVDTDGKPRKLDAPGGLGYLTVTDKTFEYIQAAIVRRALDRGNPSDNVEAGIAYVASMLKWGGDDARGLAGFIQGPGSVKENGVRPGTDEQVRRILALRDRLKSGVPAAAATTAATGRQASAVSTEPRATTSTTTASLAARAIGAARSVAGPSARIGIAGRNLVTGQRIGVAPEQTFPAASVGKLALLVEAYRQTFTGTIVLNDAQKADLRAMIVSSDNDAANRVMEALSTRAVNANLQALGLAGTRLGNPFGLSRATGAPQNVTTPLDMSRLMDMLASEQLVSSAASREMRALLLQSQDGSKIKRGLPLDARLAHKSGWYDGVANDVGIVTHGASSYVLSVFTEGIDDAEVANQTIASVAQTVHAAWGPER
ncbi:MAG: serine hydrolase [Chloroflexi bacterium]|nr:serine hydrolase [Chloroflexota bacterium]